MRVRDLLTMSTGHQTEPKLTPDEPWVKSFLAHPVEHKPGAHFLYNSAGTYMCSAIMQTLTGQTVLDYCAALVRAAWIESAEYRVLRVLRRRLGCSSARRTSQVRPALP
jgi:hypothetical protein